MSPRATIAFQRTSGSSPTASAARPSTAGGPSRAEPLGGTPADALLVGARERGEKSVQRGRVAEVAEGCRREVPYGRFAALEEAHEADQVPPLLEAGDAPLGHEETEDEVVPAHGCTRNRPRTRKDQLVASATQASRVARRAAAPHMLGMYAEALPLFVITAP